MKHDHLRLAKLFEYTVAVLLHRNGYRANVPQRYLQGRGTKHQIDVLAIDPLPMPFVFPTRILCEAKCYSDSGESALGLAYVRNLFAEVTDLQQTLPRQKKLTLEPGYDEPVSCVYTGALFSTIAFSGPAVEFANSYAISLIPLPSEIERTHLRTLMGKLQHFEDPEALSRYSGRVPGCPDDCFRGLPFDPSRIQQVLAAAAADILKLLDPEDRRVFVYALDAMLSHCPMLSEFNQCLCIHRVASIGNRLVLARIAEAEFRQLARSLAEHFLARSSAGFDNFATVSVPPEGEVQGTHGAVHSGEIGPVEVPEPTPRGFEWFAIAVLGVKVPVLALRGTYKSLRTERRPSYFTLMLDFGLVLNVRV